ncbi:uncharacterized protein BX664DRAFT_257985 [Halteromyces radiatus]|uniref:uncharacterized protein n=1 Tax=Halteromyces radiatus TaxID=101107 RepID=UPI00221F6159|nr:uncharacterized protein BX664DRAFT_257985 [Halteromyces radiatus]KAI8097127.1 hypothetical protein BX664DRAFT_257985 [Halteromyces radiatus]
MSNKNQYNVLVDMEDGAAYTQPTTIESDGLEFQAPPSASTGVPNFYNAEQQSTPGGLGKPIWSVDYYTRFFDVDTSQVVERCLKSLYPVGDFAEDTLNHQPDLYGPFWIATTVVFAVFVCSSLAGSLAAYIAGVEHLYDFRQLSYAVFVVYTYSFVCPILVWASTKYFGCQPSLLEIVDYYGYGLTVWIPVSVTRKREKLAKQMAEKKLDRSSYVNQTPFRFAERNFKSRYPPPDFSQVIYPTIDCCPNGLEPVQLVHDLRSLTPLFGVIDEVWEQRSRQAFILKELPGLIIIPNPFTPEAQRHLIQQCLSEYPKAPNTSNLHTHYDIPPTGLWPLYEREQTGTIPMNDPSYYIQRKRHTNKKQNDSYSDSDDDDDDNNTEDKGESKKVEKRTLAIPLKACDDNFKPNMDVPKPDPPAADTVPLLPTSDLIRRLRWITLGYHYHWPTKTYHLDRRYPVPDTVNSLVTSVVQAIEGIGDQAKTWKNTYRGDDYHPEAGVVNYYQYKDALMGHVDRSELNTEAPLISIR